LSRAIDYSHDYHKAKKDNKENKRKKGRKEEKRKEKEKKKTTPIRFKVRIPERSQYSTAVDQNICINQAECTFKK